MRRPLLRVLVTAALDLAPAAPADLPAVVVLLAEAGLPHADLTADGLAHFVLARDGRQLVGAVGLEVYGRWGLLRSLVVGHVGAVGAGVPARDEERLGRRREEDDGVEPERPRVGLDGGNEAPAQAGADVPDEVRQSTEFAALCPASAACLSKPLA